LNLLRLKEMLTERWNLEPIVMSGRPGKGRTLIEKFEDEAQRAVYAIALMTPDDVVSIDDDIYTQARPNVVFELGWFYGRLRRDRVCILFKKGTHIHSDLEGIERIEFTESVREKFTEIENELVASGILTR
jgi:predicted nucleotide-binding protein